MSSTAAGLTVDAMRTQTKQLEDDVHRLQLSMGEADGHQRWRLAVERALRDSLVGGDASANLDHAKQAIWQSTQALDAEAPTPAEALQMAADASTSCRLEVERGDGQVAWSASVPLRGRPAAWLLLLDLLLHRELRPGPGPAASGPDEDSMTKQQQLAAAAPVAATEASESPSAMAARTRVGSRVAPGRDWGAAAAAGVEGTVTAVDHGAGVVDVLWDGWAEPRTHCLGRRDKYHVRLLDAKPATTVFSIEEEIEEAKTRLLIQRRCIDALESQLNEVGGHQPHSKDVKILNEFMLKNLDALVQAPPADALPSTIEVQEVSTAATSQDANGGLEASVSDELVPKTLDALVQGPPADAVPSTIEVQVSPATTSQDAKGGPEGPEASVPDELVPKTLDALVQGSPKEAVPSTTGEVVEVSPARSQDANAGPETSVPDEFVLNNADALVQSPPLEAVPSTTGERVSPARGQDTDAGPKTSVPNGWFVLKNLDPSVTGPIYTAKAAPSTKENEVASLATSQDADDDGSESREPDGEADQVAQPLSSAAPLEGQAGPSLAPSSESGDGGAATAAKKNKKRKNRRRRFKKRQASQTNDDDEPPSPSSKHYEANLPRLKLVVDKLAENPRRNTRAKRKAVEDARKMGVRVLSSLWCLTDTEWHLSLLRAAWPTLEKLHCRIVTFECLELVNSMPRLRRLYVASDPDLYENPRPLTPLPGGRAGALEWLRAYMPMVTLRSLLAAHARTLREVVVCVGTLSDAVTRSFGSFFFSLPQYPYICGDLHPLFEGRRFPSLRRVVVWRSTSFQHEAPHCRAQLFGLRRVLPKAVSVVCSVCDHGVRVDEFYE